MSYQIARRRRIRRLLVAAMGGGITYALYDQFTTDRAAGAVNGTAAEPTGQARTVTDTNSKLSITGGVASFATGGAAAGDPLLKYPAMTTIAGMTLMAVIVPNGTTGGAVGWDDNGSGIALNSVRFFAVNLNVVFNATVNVNVGVYTNGSSYTVAVIQRANGYYYFIKGGTEFPKWTLVWVSDINAAGTWIPSLPATGVSDIHTVDNVRIPNNLYIPQPLAYDTFTRSNGALGSTETSGPDSQGVAAIAWAFSSGVWVVSSNVAVGTPALGSDLAVNGTFAADANWNKGAGWTISSGTANASAASSDLQASANPLTTHNWYQVVYTLSAFSAGTVLASVGGIALPTHAANATYTETAKAGSAVFKFTGAGFTGSLDNVTIKQITLADMFSTVDVGVADVIIDAAITGPTGTSGIQGGVIVNLDSVASPANFIIAYLTGTGNLKLDECVAGVYTNKINTSVTYSAGAVLRVIRDGTSCWVFYNNAAVGTVQTMSSNVSTKHGKMTTSALVSFDNVTIWARGTGGQYAQLDAF